MRRIGWIEQLRQRLYKWRKSVIRGQYASMIRQARRERDLCRRFGKDEWANFCAFRARIYRVSALFHQLGMNVEDIAESGATASEARSDLTTSGVSDETSTSGSSGDTESK
jgi:hypothetical protein